MMMLKGGLQLGGRPVKPVELAVVVTMGLVMGLLIGYILMGTAHAIFEIGTDEHYKHMP